MHLVSRPKIRAKNKKEEEERGEKKSKILST